jgi:hypothetical protein
LADCHHALEEAWRIYLVRSLGFQPEPSSHDWHVQPSCQRTDPLPPERALSVQCRNTRVRLCLSSKLVQTTRLARPLSTRCDHRISTCFPQPGSALLKKHCHSEPPTRRTCATRGVSRNLLFALFQHATKRISRSAPVPFRHKPRRKTISLKKDHLEVLANNA